MSVTSMILLLIIASICGSVGAGLAGSSKKGCLGSIALGFIGSFLGQYIANKFSLPEFFSLKIGGESFPVIWSIVGSAIFVAVLGFLGGREKE